MAKLKWVIMKQATAKAKRINISCKSLLMIRPIEEPPFSVVVLIHYMKFLPCHDQKAV
jgi:hypothetical protein